MVRDWAAGGCRYPSSYFLSLPPNTVAFIQQTEVVLLSPNGVTMVVRPHIGNHIRPRAGLAA